MDMQMPDGTVVQGIPDGTPKDEINKKFSGKFGLPEYQQSYSSALAQQNKDFMEGPVANAAQIGDMILGAPARFAKDVAEGSLAGLHAAGGDSDAIKSAALDIHNSKANPLIEFMSSPLAHILGTSSEGTITQKAMDKVNGVIDNAAEFYSKQTGNPVVGDAVKSFLNLAMDAAGVKGIEAAHAQIDSALKQKGGATSGEGSNSEYIPAGQQSRFGEDFGQAKDTGNDGTPQRPPQRLNEPIDTLPSPDNLNVTTPRNNGRLIQQNQPFTDTTNPPDTHPDYGGFDPSEVPANTRVPDDVVNMQSESLLREMMKGNADPKLLAGLAAVGITAAVYAALDEDRKKRLLEGLGLAGLALATKGRTDSISGLRVFRDGVPGLDKFVKVFEQNVTEPEFGDPVTAGRSFHQAEMNVVANKSQMFKTIQAATDGGVTPEIGRYIQDKLQANQVGATMPVSQHIAELMRKYSDPIAKDIKALEAKLPPEDVKLFNDEFSHRIALQRSLLSDLLTDRVGQSISPQRFGARAPSEKARTVFQLGDSVITVKRVQAIPGIRKGGWQATRWQDNVPTTMPLVDKPIEAGSMLDGMKVEHAQQKNIELHTPIRYLENGIAVQAHTLASLQKAVMERAFIKKLTKDGIAQDWMAENDYHAPADFRKLGGEAQVMFPSLRDNVFNPQWAEVLDDFAGRYGGKIATVVDGLNNLFVRAMMLNPLPHINNEFAHLFIARGASGWISPRQLSQASMGLPGLKFLPDAIKSVMNTDDFQMLLMRDGGFLLAPQVRNMLASAEEMKTLNHSIPTIGVRELLKDTTMRQAVSALAATLGATVGQLLMHVSNKMQLLMWSARDMMYTQLVMEQMGMGKTMAGAIEEVGKHMPEYWMPSRVMGSRAVSQAMQSRLLMFERYHYGWVKSLGESAGEVLQLQRAYDQTVPRVSSEYSGAKLGKGVDHLLGMALGGAIIWYGINKMYSSMFGQNADQRWPGVYHGVAGVHDFLSGKKGIQAAISPMVTFNPALMAATELAQNRDWAGKPIIPQGSKPGDVAFLLTRYAAGKLTPIQGIERDIEGKSSLKSNLANMMDVKLQNDLQDLRDMQRANGQARSAEALTNKLKQKYGLGK